MVEYNYILVRVEESKNSLSKGLNQTRAGRLRKAIHEASDELQIAEADMVIRFDRVTDYYGQPSLYPEIHKMFTERLAVAKASMQEPLFPRRGKPWTPGTL